MKTLISTLLLSQAFSTVVLAKESMADQVKKFNWNGIEVVYLKDNRFPVYNLGVYFADGSLGDLNTEKGLTNYAFNLIDSGTKDLTQSQILEKLEYMATTVSANVTHEYTTVNISGLTKDIDQSIPFICQVIKEANYPKAVVDRELALAKNNIESLRTNHRQLISRISREESLANSPYSYPVEGKIKDFKSYTGAKMRERVNYFLNNVKKRIYITGPEEALKMEKYLTTNCGLKGNANDFVREIKDPKIVDLKPRVIFAPVSDANQVQFFAGRIMNNNELDKSVLDAMTAELLGGGFTSKLNRELRVKRGLTYGAGAYIAAQKQYGRIGISTFTKNQTLEELVNVANQTVINVAANVSDEDLNNTISGLKGSHPFGFEKSSAFLGQLIYLDHIGRPYSELFDFNQKLDQYKAQDVAQRVNDMFSFKKATIVILGDKSLEARVKKLAKNYGQFKVVNINNYL